MNSVRRGFFREVALVVLLCGGVSASQAGTFQAFADALQERGWQVAWDPQGNLILSGFHKAAPGAERLTRQTPTAAPSVTPRPAVTDELARRLAATGWQVARDRDGSLLLTGFTRPSPVLRKAEPAAPPSATEGLAARLAATGWQVARDRDGSLLLTGFTRPSPVLRKAEPAPLPDATGGLATVLPTPRAMPIATTALAERLTATGWHVGRDARGRLLFSRAVPAATSAATWRADRSAERRPPLDRLADRLAASGWWVGRDGEGGIILRRHGGRANAPSLAQADPAGTGFRIGPAQRQRGTTG